MGLARLRRLGLSVPPASAFPGDSGGAAARFMPAPVPLQSQCLLISITRCHTYLSTNKVDAVDRVVLTHRVLVGVPVCGCAT